MARICEACGLKSPDSAVMCDCGRQLRAVDSKTLAAAKVANQEVRSTKVVAYSVGVSVAVIFLLIVLRVFLRVI